MKGRTIVPDEILAVDRAIRSSFFDEYCASTSNEGLGTKRLKIKGKSDMMGLFA